jgi:Zn2+/Cd2+-exporting ATPase
LWWVRPSEGITGTDASGAVWAGNARMVARMAADGAHVGLSALRGGSQTVVHLGRGARLMGAVADSP